jgi:hypothetical protein
MQHFAISSDQPVEGDLAVSVEMAAFASSETRPGRQSEAAQCVQEQVWTVCAADSCLHVLSPCEHNLSMESSKRCNSMLLVQVMDTD